MKICTKTIKKTKIKKKLRSEKIKKQRKTNVAQIICFTGKTIFVLVCQK